LETVSVKRRLPPLTPSRAERLAAQVPLVSLAHESGIPLVVLSLAERNLRCLNPEQERARREALERLAAHIVPEEVTP